MFASLGLRTHAVLPNVRPCLGDINGDGSSYASAVRENILASGDICSRAIMIGSILGLVGAGCPESFSSKLDATHAARVRAASEAIAELRAAADF